MRPLLLHLATFFAAIIPRSQAFFTGILLSYASQKWATWQQWWQVEKKLLCALCNYILHQDNYKSLLGFGARYVLVPERSRLFSLIYKQNSCLPLYDVCPEKIREKF